MIPEFPAAVPEISVSDINAAPKYYRDKFSFSLDWVEADIASDRLGTGPCRYGTFLNA